MEKLERDSTDPKYVPDSKGASADTGKYLQAVALAAQLGKSVEEVFQFMGTTTSINVPQPVSVTAPVLGVTSVIENVIEDIPEEEIKVVKAAKIPKEVPSDGFVVTETVDPSEATEADLAKLSEEEEEQNWDSKIRIGSIVKIIYQVNASRINWVGKRGKVTRIVGNEAAKVYEVEFKGRKVPKVRINKKSGKLERGFENKPLRNTFSEDQVELDS